MKITTANNGYYSPWGYSYISISQLVEKYGMHSEELAIKELERMDRESDEAFAAFERNHPELNP